jgi:hypothetical protein
MFQFKRDFSDDFRKAPSVERARELNPRLQSFDQWLAANKERMPVE